MIKTMYKVQDGQTLIVSGHMTDGEVKALQHEGYKLREPQVNKHGIRVVS